MAPSKIKVPAQLLQDLHRMLCNKTELAGQLQRGPRTIKAGEAMVAQAQAGTEAAKEAVKQAKLASDEKQLQLKSRESRIEDLKAKLNTAASNREFDTFKEQIAADQQANNVLSDEILEGLERLDELDLKLKAAEAELVKQKQEQQARIGEIEKRMTVVQSDLAHVVEELAKAETQFPSEAKDVYNRLIASKGDEALAPLEDSTCSACNQTLTTHVVDQLILSVMLHCPNCNTLLYMPTQSNVG